MSGCSRLDFFAQFLRQPRVNRSQLLDLFVGRVRLAHARVGLAEAVIGVSVVSLQAYGTLNKRNRFFKVSAAQVSIANTVIRFGITGVETGSPDQRCERFAVTA